VSAEIFGDVAVALAPVGHRGRAQARPLTRGAALLTGARGRPRVGLAAAAGATAALSRLGATCRDVNELEINPLVVTPAGAVAFDARVVCDMLDDANLTR
jgi:hypothetical protein